MPQNNDYGGLSPKQIQALHLIALGQTDEAVAEDVGVTRQTVNKWKNHHLEFKEYLAYERVQLVQSYSDRIRALVPKAMQVVEDALESDNERIRVTVALALLKILKEVPLMAEIKHPNSAKESERNQSRYMNSIFTGF